MAWTPPVTWVDNTVYDDTDFDAQIGGNLSFLYSPPSCLSQSNADQNLTSSGSSETPLNMQTEQWDTDSIHSTVSNTYRHEINTAGTYLIYAGCMFSLASVAGGRLIQLDRSTGSDIRALMTGTPVLWNTCLQIAHTGLFGTSDYYDLEGRQNSGITLPVLAGTAIMLSHWCGNP